MITLIFPEWLGWIVMIALVASALDSLAGIYIRYLDRKIKNMKEGA